MRARAAAEAQQRVRGHLAAQRHNASPGACGLVARVLAVGGVAERVVGCLGLFDQGRAAGVCAAFSRLCGAALGALPRPMVAGGCDDYIIDKREVWALEVSTMRWRPLPQLLQARREHACVALQCGTVLCIGGADRKTVEALAPGAEQWAPRPRLSSGFYGGGAVACGDGSVLLLGGCRNDVCRSSAEVTRLDPQTGQCEALPPLSSRRARFGCAPLPDGRVVLAGGNNGNDRLATAEVYDPATGASTRLPDLPAPRSGAACCWLSDGRLAVLGGFTGGGASSACWAYSFARNAWEPLPDLTMLRDSHAAWCVGGCVFVAGGEGGARFMDSVEVLEEGGDQWRPLPSARLPAGTISAGSCLLPPR